MTTPNQLSIDDDNSSLDPTKDDDDELNYFIIPRVIDDEAKILAQEEADLEEDEDTNQHFFSDQLKSNRPKWEKSWFCAMNMIVFAVDLSILDGFPKALAGHGGMVFVVAYLVCICVLSIPFLFMEVAVGQYFQTTMLGMWGICPIFRGIGLSCYITALMYCSIGPVVVMWSMYMLLEAISVFKSGKLPWVSCNNQWNTCQCKGDSEELRNEECTEDLTNHTNTPGMEYFVGVVLKFWKTKYENPEDISSVVENGNESYGFGNLKEGLGEPIVKSGLFMAAIFVFIIVITLSSRKSIGWTHSFTATFPFVVLILLICRGLSLEGGVSGIATYMSPKWEKFVDYKMWLSAMSLSFYSLGPGIGIHLSIASYNELHHNVFRDVAATVLVDFLTGLLSSLVCFSFLGYLYKLEGKTLPAELTGIDITFPFTQIPGILAHIAGASFFSVIFYSMICLLVVDTATCAMATLTIALCEEYRRKYPDQTVPDSVFTYPVWGLSFIMSLTLITRGGFWVFIYTFNYTFAFSFTIFPILQCLVFSWIWGVDNICHAVEFIMRKRPSLYYRLCWKFVCPLSVVVFLFTSIQNQEYKALTAFGVTAPESTRYFAILLVFAAPSLTVLFMIYEIIHLYPKAGGSCLKLLMLLISPEYEHKEIIKNVWNAKRLKLHHYLFMFFPDEIDNTPFLKKVHNKIHSCADTIIAICKKKDRREEQVERERRHHHHQEGESTKAKRTSAWEKWDEIHNLSSSSSKLQNTGKNDIETGTGTNAGAMNSNPSQAPNSAVPNVGNNKKASPFKPKPSSQSPKTK